jgi:Protein of unknwon function (DUF3310)
MEKGFIEVTNGRWWYEDKVGEVFRIHREIESYDDEALAKPERAFEVIDEEHGYCRVLARDCREWERRTVNDDAFMPFPEKEASEYEAQVKWIQELEARLAKQEAEAKQADVGPSTTDQLGNPITPVDMVNHPNHYTYGKFEVIEIIEEVTKAYDDAYMGYCIGNAQKYIARAPHKGTKKQDLEKARKYLEFAIDHLAKNEN